ADNHWQQEYNLKKQAAASRNSGGGGSRGTSGGGSSSNSLPSVSSRSSLNGYTRDQINWYSNPSNAPYAYGQKKEEGKKAPSYVESLLMRKPLEPSLLQKFGPKGFL
ncbi:hypothetical protein ACUBUI_34805, partial [Bacillus sp. Fil]